jgi:hypothetical protein
MRGVGSGAGTAHVHGQVIRNQRVLIDDAFLERRPAVAPPGGLTAPGGAQRHQQLILRKLGTYRRVGAQFPQDRLLKPRSPELILRKVPILET